MHEITINMQVYSWEHRSKWGILDCYIWLAEGFLKRGILGDSIGWLISGKLLANSYGYFIIPNINKPGSSGSQFFSILFE